MFTAVAQKSLADAEKYFDEHLEQNDYYSAGEIRPGQWIGASADRLGLKQNVTREQFHALCENRNPQNHDRLTQRQKKEDKRRVGGVSDSRRDRRGRLRSVRTAHGVDSKVNLNKGLRGLAKHTRHPAL